MRLIDKNNNFWFSDRSNRAYIRLEIERNEIKKITTIPVNTGVFVARMYTWNNKIYAIEQGVDTLNMPTYHFIEFDDQLHSKCIIDRPTHAKLIDFVDGNIWCQTDTSWQIIDLDDHVLFEIQFKDYAVSMGGNHEFSNVLEDGSGKHFLTSEFGLHLIDIRKNPFQLYFSKSKDYSPPFNNPIRGIYADKNHVIANVEFGGLVRIPKDNPMEFEVVSRLSYPDLNHRSYNGRPLLHDANGNFWIGHHNVLSKWSNNFVTQKQVSRTSDINFSKEICWALWEDNDTCIWSANQGDLRVLCKSDSIQTSYTYLELGFNFNELDVYHFETDHHLGNSDFVWICTNKGLYIFDRLNKKVISRYHQGGKGNSNIPANTIHHLYIDHKGNKWLATNKGLVYWDKKTDKKQLYNRNDGLLNEVIYAIYDDNRDRLWMSSDYGIICFDKSTKAIQTYLPEDGIAQEEFNRISHYQAEDGTIYFGGLNGITAFHPDAVIQSVKKYNAVLLSQLEVFNGGTENLEDRTGEAIRTGTIIFRPTDKYLKIKFTIPKFDQSNQTFYGWKIDGVFDDWSYQNENTLQFGSLPYGTHKLTIKGQNNNAGWSPYELELEISVRKPFYMQHWFLIFTASILAFGARAYSKKQIRKFNQDKENLEHEIERATTQIRKDKTLIEKQAEELSNLEELKSRFFANVSHELRTPLSLMIGPIKRLKTKNGQDAEGTRLLDFIERNSLHLKGLVNEILDVSKLENSKIKLTEEPIYFYNYLRTHMSQFYSYGTCERIKVSVDIPDSTELNILIDKNKFEKIINNLLSNALKFTPSPGAVHLNVIENEKTIILKISDTGRGIHPADLPHVFDRFYQTRQTNVMIEGGTGIGLSLCKELAELMDGRIWCESTLGQGSHFYFEFPKRTVQNKMDLIPYAHIDIDQQNGSSVKGINIPPTGASFIGTSILIVEDNKDLREYYKIILSDYDVILTEHGQAALDYLNQAKNPPDIIISDLMMPVMDGLQLLDHLKSNDLWRHIPVIMLTAKANRDIKIKALRIGIDDYMTKPFDDEELLVRIHNLLNNYNLRNSIQGNEIKSSKKEISKKISQQDQKWIQELEMYILKHMDDSRFSMDFIAQFMNLSRRHLQRRIKMLVGLTPKEYVNEIRFHDVKHKLQEGEITSVKQAASKCGFSNVSYFSKLFKNRYGKSPSAYI